jgi:RND family efflux transporter MFP subunit
MRGVSFIWIILFVSLTVQAGAELQPVERVLLPNIHPLTGKVEAVNQATMTAQTSGRIAELYFDVNDVVSKGEVLARLRSEPQKAELDVAEAEHERAQAEFNRINDLYERKLVALAMLDQARATLKTAEARLNSARESFDYTVIRAPYSGIVTKRHVEIGESVRPGSPLVSGIALNELRIAVDVPQSLVDAVRANKKAYVDIAPGKRIDASKITVFPYADELSHGFTARIDLPRGVEGLYPGMLVTVNFIAGETMSLVVPAQSVVNRGEVQAVYVQRKDGGVAMRQVRLGRLLENNRREIHAGVAEGELVFVDPLAATVALKQGAEK